MEHNACPEASLATSQELERLVALRTQELQSQLKLALQRFEQAPCGHLTMDADLKMIDINQTLLNWLGYEREELIAAPDLGHLIDPGWCRVLQPRLQGIAQSGLNESMEIELIRKDGSRLPVLMTSAAIMDDEGAFAYSHSSLVDITERKQIEQRITAHDGFLQTITDRIPVELAYYDKDLVCRFANRAHATRYDKHPEEMVGENLSNLVAAELLPEILPHVAEALSG
jgi:PAS domain S-box-containing protein